MRPPLSYVPLLPWTLLVVASIIALKLTGVFETHEPALADGKQNYSGRIVEITESATRATVTSEFRDTSGVPFKALLTLSSGRSDLSIGDNIEVAAKLSKPRIDDSSPEPFNYPGYLRDKGITATGFVSPTDITVRTTAKTSLPQASEWRRRCALKLVGSSLSEGCAAFLNTAMLGDASLMPGDARDTFSGAGLAHILALSGMHVGIISTGLLVLLFPLTLLRWRSVRLLLTVILLWGYAFLTGLSPSVIRAVIMATCLSGGYILQRRHVPLNSLMLAAIIILLFSPTELFDVGFQLSFLAVTGILLIMPPAVRLLPRRRPFIFLFMSAILMSVSATMATGILSMHYFHTFPLYFLPANLLAMPLLPPLIGGGALLLIAEWFNYDPEWLCRLLDFLYNAVFRYADWISQLPHSAIRHIYLPVWILPFYYAVGGLLVYWLWTRRKWAIMSSVAMGALIAPIPAMTEAPKPSYEYFMPRDNRHVSLVYFDGESAKLITPSGMHIARDLSLRGMARHKEFLGRRGIDSIVPVPDEYDSEAIARRGKYVELHGTKYLFVDCDSLPPEDRHVNYAVVCNGFKGDIIKLARTVIPDTVMLGSNLNIRRHDRYADSLSRHGIPYISLRTGAHYRKSP